MSTSVSSNEDIFDLKSDFKNQMMDQIDDMIWELIRMRKELDMTQSELAAAIGVPQATISRMESFAVVPTLKTFIAVANTLGCRLALQKCPNKRRE